MSQRADEAFEEALKSTLAGLKFSTGEPGLGVLRDLFILIQLAGSDNPVDARNAQLVLRELDKQYEYIRIHDDNWSNPARPKRVTKPRPEMLSPKCPLPFSLVKRLWPVLPLLSLIHRTERTTGAAKKEASAIRAARIQEYCFVFLCTMPKAMQAHLYAFATDVLRSKARRYKLDAEDLALAVLDDLKRRRAPVARYRARAKTIDEAAPYVRNYVAAMLKKRALDVLPKLTNDSVTAAPSTRRRWLRRGVFVGSPDQERKQRDAGDEAQRHVPKECCSMAEAERRTGRYRSVLTTHLPAAERRFGFVAKRGPDGTYWLTPEQVDQLKSVLPPPRRPRSP